jgi:hypothetical protein
MLSVLRPYIFSNRMINEYGKVGGMKIHMGNQSTQRSASHMT